MITAINWGGHVTEMVKDEIIAGILDRSETAEQACQGLVEQALEAGGRDNVTVIVARYRFPVSAGLRAPCHATSNPSIEL